MKFPFLLLLIMSVIACASHNKSLKYELSTKSNFSYLSYYQLIYEADILFLEKKYIDAKKIYEKAFEMFEPLNQPTLYEIEHLAQIYDSLNELSNCEKYILKLIDIGYPLEYFTGDEQFKNLLKSKYWKNIKKKYPYLRKNYLSKIDTSLRHKIKQMVKEDQFVRHNNKDASEIKKIDSINQSFLFSLFEAGIYPNETIIGNYWIDKQMVRADVLLLHTSDSIRINYFIPKLMEFVISGKCAPELLGSLVDQYYIYKGKNPLFATYYGENYTILKPQNPEIIDVLRTSIGLQPIKLKLIKDHLNNINSTLWKN